MKKILMFAAAALLTFAACKPDNSGTNPDPSKEPSKEPSENPSVDPGTPEEPVSVVLLSRNIDVAGDFEYEISIIEKKVIISLAYADKDEAKALDVEFIGLPTDIEADYVNPYDYSDSKTQEIVFKRKGSTDSGKWDKWTMGVEVDAEIPHFISLIVGGYDITSAEQTLRFDNGTDLTAITVEYEVSPEGAVVTANGQPFESGDAVDFSDKLNGVKIAVQDGEEEFLIKAETSGLSSISRVWGHYVAPVSVTDTWYTEKLGFDWSIKGNWDRNVALDDKYVYLAATESDAGTAGDYLAKVWAIDIADPDNVISMSVPSDIPAQHKTAGLAIAPDGNGTRLLVCTMAMGAAHKFQVYSYTSPTAAPELVLDVPFSSIGERIGDRITFFGTWQKGEICSVSWASGAAYIFPVTDGKVSTTFIKADLKNGGLSSTVGGNGAKLVKYSDIDYLWCGTGYPIVMKREGNTFTQVAATDKDNNFGSPNHGFNFFEVNGSEYAVFAFRENSFQDSGIRVFELTQPDFKESILNNPIAEHSYKFGLGDPDIDNLGKAGQKDANGICDTAVRVIDGKVYIAAAGCGSGISLFKVE